MTTKHLLKTAMAAAFMLLLCFTTKAQSVTMFIQSGGFDNCSNPLPNAGTYTHSGSVNGKNAYVKNAQLKIIWTGSQWELQGWDNTVYSTPNFLTLWYNTNNTATPPADCWAASFGCFPIGMSGPDAFPAMSVAPTLTTANADTTNATTVNYTVTFTSTINSLSTSNFSIATTGTISGASITSVSQTSGNVWNVAVNTGSGDGDITLSMDNVNGASAIICALPTTGPSYTIVKTAPSITSNPANANACSSGGSASFTVGASGIIANYTWQESTNGGSSWSTVSDGGVYSGATTATLSISNTNGFNGYQYQAKANNVAGSSSFSTAATLTLSSSQNWYFDGDGDGYGNSSTISSTSLINETFGSVLPTNWAQTNNSTSAGTNWFQGAGSSNITFSAHSGTTNEFIAADYQSLNGATGTVDLWLFTPTVSLQNGNTFTFWTRTQDNTQFPDRMEVRMSTNGSSTTVADFSTSILTINPSLVTGNTGYPMTWTQYTATVSGISGTVTGRFAFRYYVTNSGSSGANGYGIGIDDVTYGFSGSPVAACAQPNGYVSNNSDCNDANASITTGSTWYLDADNDGHYVSSTVACSSPGAGYNQTATVSGDCDDNDNTKWQNATLYVDADGDGYDAGTATVCYGNTAPSGYSLTTNGSDCNDAIFNSTLPAATQSITNKAICAPQLPYSYLGHTMNAAGNDTLHLTNAAGCDSMAILSLTVNTTTSSSATLAPPTGNNCFAGATTFTATATNGGANPIYEWFVNGSSVGFHPSPYTRALYINNSIVKVKLYPQGVCATPSMSNNDTVQVVKPQATVTRNGGAVICAGTPITFRAMASGISKNPSLTYQWTINRNPVGGNIDTFMSATLQTHDTVRCKLIDAACPSNPALSNQYFMNITPVPALVPSVSITAPISNSICFGATNTMTATATNGGAHPIYEWFQNGVSYGFHGATYTNTFYINNTTVKVKLYTGVVCAATPFSNNDTLQVVSPKATVTRNGGVIICAGTPITFRAMASGISKNPSLTYQWTINRNTVGGNIDTFMSATLQTHDTVRCKLVDAACPALPSYSNQYPMTIASAALTASVSLAAPSANNVCFASPVTFTATSSNSGVNPVYQWFLNGANDGFHTSPYTRKIYTNNSIVNVKVYPQVACANTAMSNSDTIKIHTCTVIRLQAPNSNDDKETIAGIELYPNPAMDNVTIRYQLPENNVDAAVISILDITGKMVQTQTIEHPETIGVAKFDLSNLQAGVYLVNVKTTGFTQTQKLVVSK